MSDNKSLTVDELEASAAHYASRAKDRLKTLLLGSYPADNQENYLESQVSDFVDLITASVVMEMTALHKRAAQEARLNSTDSSNLRNTDMKNLVLYHADCLDGFGAALAAWLNLPHPHTEFQAVQYDEPVCEIPVAGRKVFILDFSYPAEEMNRIFIEAHEVVWLDHHETAFKRWCPDVTESLFEQRVYIDAGEPKLCHVVLDKEQSGAMLAWRYFYRFNVPPALIQHIDDQDRWQFKYSTTKPFIAYLASRDRTFKAWDEVYEATQRSGTALAEMYKFGEVLLQERERQIESILKLASRCELEDKETGKQLIGLAANCPAFLRSDVGSRLAEQSGTFGATWFLQANGVVKVSLRSVSDFDVERLAAQRGGGGHKRAASFYVSMRDMEFYDGE